MVVCDKDGRVWEKSRGRDEERETLAPRNRVAAFQAATCAPSLFIPHRKHHRGFPQSIYKGIHGILSALRIITAVTSDTTALTLLLSEDDDDSYHDDPSSIISIAIASIDRARSHVEG